MSRQTVHGIGGVFFRAKDPKQLGDWYRQHLGFELQPWGGVVFPWKRADTGADAYSIWSPFAEDSEYFKPSDKAYMLNLRVDDLDAMLAQLRADGCQVLDRREDGEYGRFGYVLDPEGTLLELWQPPATPPGA